MNRRDFFKRITLYSSIASACLLDADTVNTFNISINGDLDDDLIILKSTPFETTITDIHQMHNPSGIFNYNGNIYNINHNPGYIKFKKEFSFYKHNKEIYLVCLANEREEANITKRIRTHYKNEKLYFNNKLFLPDLMPEYNSVPDYPLWFGADETSKEEKKDVNGNAYNYYHLFDNTTVQLGIIVPFTADTKIYLYNQKNELVYTYEEIISKKPQKIKSNEVKKNSLSPHPFAEINNVLNNDKDISIINNDFITTILISYDNDFYTIPMPYPLMYPNLIFGVSNE